MTSIVFGMSSEFQRRRRIHNAWAVEREARGAAGRDPVAMMAFSKTRRRSPPCPFNLQRARIEERGAPRMKSTLRCCSIAPNRPVSLFTTPSFHARFVEIDHRLGELNPQSAAWRDSPMTLATCSNAFEGMQPR